MQLYSFFNSSTSYRVRIALALKGVSYDTVPVNIRVGEHMAADYLANVNPSASVPVLIDGDFRLGQSLAIIGYLDKTYPGPRLIPIEPDLCARVLEVAALISCDIHPINNLRVLRYLETELKVTPEQKSAWYGHWIAQGMTAVERLLERSAGGPWCFGSQPTLADICLVPQMANALRMGCDLSGYQRAIAVYQHACKNAAFKAAQPQFQPDYIAP